MGDARVVRGDLDAISGRALPTPTVPIHQQTAGSRPDRRASRCPNDGHLPCADLTSRPVAAGDLQKRDTPSESREGQSGGLAPGRTAHVIRGSPRDVIRGPPVDRGASLPGASGSDSGR